MDCGSNSILSILATREGPRKVLIISSVGRTIVMKDAQNGKLQTYLIYKKYKYYNISFIIRILVLGFRELEKVIG
jgi:hypothetical protein